MMTSDERNGTRGDTKKSKAVGRTDVKAGDRQDVLLERAGQPERLLRSAVFRKVPLAERMKLDQAIILRPEGMATLKEIARKRELNEKYGVSEGELESYAEKIEELVRPEITSHVLAGVLGCLPKTYRDRLTAGNEVLILSRVFQSMSTKDAVVPVADMAKLASILMALSRSPRQPERRNVRKGGRSSKMADNQKAKELDPIKVRESVRIVYGLDCLDEHTELGPNSGRHSPEKRMERETPEV